MAKQIRTVCDLCLRNEVFTGTPVFTVYVKSTDKEYTICPPCNHIVMRAVELGIARIFQALYDNKEKAHE